MRHGFSRTLAAFLRHDLSSIGARGRLLSDRRDQHYGRAAEGRVRGSVGELTDRPITPLTPTRMQSHCRGQEFETKRAHTMWALACYAMRWLRHLSRRVREETSIARRVLPTYFHISREKLPLGAELRAKGGPHIDDEIEACLEKARPNGRLARVDAIYLLDHADFTKSGIPYEEGYVHLVEPHEPVQSTMPNG